MPAPSDATPSPTPSRRSLIWVAVAVVIGLLLTAGLKSFRDLAEARDQQSDLESKIQATDERIETLRERLRLIDEDPATLERLAREQLGMVHPDDVVIVLPPDDGDRAASTRPDGSPTAPPTGDGGRRPTP